MLVIRFARTGKKKQAYFRVVVAEKERAVTAKFVEILGNYDPHAKKLSVNKERVEYFLKNGAQPSDTVARILAKEGFELPKWVNIKEKKKAPKKEVEEKPVAAPAEGSEPVESAEGGEQPESAEAPAESAGGTEAAEEAAPAEAPEQAEDTEATQESETEEVKDSGETAEEKSDEEGEASEEKSE